jgi:adenosylmethionine-8-amino-7-oxononanoate aminotransferase
LDYFGKPDLIAGIATGGVPQGVLVAQELGIPFIYVRSSPKEHGMGNIIEGYFENRLHSLRAAPHVLDIRNFGMIGAIELKPRPDAPGARGHELYLKCFEAGVLIRETGDTVAMSPPLIISEQEIDMLFSVLAEQLAQIA